MSIFNFFQRKRLQTQLNMCCHNLKNFLIKVRYKILQQHVSQQIWHFSQKIKFKMIFFTNFTTFSFARQLNEVFPSFIVASKLKQNVEKTAKKLLKETQITVVGLST